MSTRVVDIEKPYEWGTAIEVTQDKVINLRLRSENNLIIYDEGDNEIYVDLQLPSDIEPADAIPVWINTGRVLAADWWDYTGTIVVFKTTSWDNIKLLYADNGRVFIDNWTGTFKEIYLKWDVDALISGLRGYIDDELAKKQDKLTAWANITIAEDPQTHELVISSTGWGWASYTAWNWINIDANDEISVDTSVVATQSDLADKQDKLTAWDNITIGEVSEWDTQWPAPDGFHVPLKDEWVAIYNILITTFWLQENARTMGIYLKMPMAGTRSSFVSDIEYVGTYGYYWSSTATHGGDYACFLTFDSSRINPQDDAGTGEGCSVRCFKNIPVIPTSSWTALYQGSWSAWVFYNATDGLISVSWDGTAWYTIMDKNLGATTVYNQWDIETDANCGYIYQWGNNYWFAHSWTVTTSNMQVNVSNYWPWNYYSGNEFITSMSRTFIPNENLWGWVSQWQRSSLEISVDSSTVALKSDLSVVSWDSNTYSIVVSNSAPAAWTPNTTLTFVV